MKQPALVIIKPDGISKKIVGNILTEFAGKDLEIVAVRMIETTRSLAEEHYKQIKGKPFFEDTVSYFCGKFHKINKLVAFICFGEEAVSKCRKIAGATNPKDAAPGSIRGDYGRVSPSGIYENVVHVSSDSSEAEREIKLWFNPNDVTVNLYPVKTETVHNYKKEVWV